jgi:glutathione synthase
VTSNDISYQARQCSHLFSVFNFSFHFTMSNELDVKAILSNWPPSLTANQLHELTLQATTYAFSNGLLYLPVADRQPPSPTSAIHAPLALFPSPFPRSLFELAKRLQHLYNVLYSRVAQDEAFLDEIMGTEKGVGRVDEFIGQLWSGWKTLRDEGLIQVRVILCQLGKF